jgi:energy-coupling factor transport system permease protein
MSEDRRAQIERAIDNPAGGPSGVVEYEPGDTFLHRLHPLTKITLAVGLSVLVFLLADFWGPLAVVLVVLGGLTAFGILDVARTGLVISFPIGASLLVVHGLFNPANATPLFAVSAVPAIGTFVVWEEGVRFGLLFYFRLLAIILSLLTLVKTTHPRRLANGLTDKGVPSNLAYVFMATLQLAPQMKDEARSIAAAQQARGLDTEANVVERFKSLVAMLTPLLIGMLIASQTRALALESRGFSRKGPKTYLIEVADTTLDRGLRWGTVVALAAALAWQVLL